MHRSALHVYWREEGIKGARSGEEDTKIPVRLSAAEYQMSSHHSVHLKHVDGHLYGIIAARVERRELWANAFATFLHRKPRAARSPVGHLLFYVQVTWVQVRQGFLRENTPPTPFRFQLRAPRAGGMPTCQPTLQYYLPRYSHGRCVADASRLPNTPLCFSSTTGNLCGCNVHMLGNLIIS